jgi:hypothetical protein
MDEEERKPLLSQDVNPPAYYPPTAPAVYNQMGSRQPQGNDTYMTYQEWWDKHNVPADIQSKSVREQETWMAERRAESLQRRQREQEKLKEQQETIQELQKYATKAKSEQQSCFAYGACAACVVFKILSGTP